MRDRDLFTLDDCTRAGYCPSGIVKWCKSIGVKPGPFLSRLKEGIPRAEAEAMRDGMIDRALALKDLELSSEPPRG